jgi:16S rRNA (uracil1498-N3)-methyltransferase
MPRVYRFFPRTEKIKPRLGAAGDLRIHEHDENEIFIQMIKVLRVRPGDKVVFLGNDGFENIYEIVSAHKKEVVLNFIKRIKNINELPFKLELVLCMPNRPEKLDLITQKAVELGVCRIILLESDFSQMKHKLREERLNKILTEAAEQSERAFVPELKTAGKLTDYLSSAGGKNLLVALERSESKPLPEMIDGKDASILIGPEGGFSDAEKTAIRSSGARTFSLGPRILRSETAAILSLGIASLNPSSPQESA